MNHKVDKAFLKKLEDVVEAGAQYNKEIAQGLMISVETWYNLLYGKRKNGKEEKAKIANALKRGKEKQLENSGDIALTSLIKKLTGFNATEEEQNIVIDEEGKEQIMSIKRKIKYYAPDTTALIFELVNSGKRKNINKIIEKLPDEKINVKLKSDDADND